MLPSRLSWQQGRDRDHAVASTKHGAHHARRRQVSVVDRSDGWLQGARDEVAVQMGGKVSRRVGRFKQIGHKKVQAGVGGEARVPT